MKKKEWVTLLMLLAGVLVGCEDCKETRLTTLLFPVEADAILSPSDVEYRELSGGITCINSEFTAVASSFSSNELVADFRAATGNASFGDYGALAAVIHSEGAFNALKNGGCLNDLDAAVMPDFDIQTLVVFTVFSAGGCDETTQVTLLENASEQAHLALQVTYIPDDTCTFNVSETVVIDQRMAVANLAIYSGCSDNKAADPEM